MLEPVTRYTGVPSGAYTSAMSFIPSTGEAPNGGRCLSAFGYYKGAGAAFIQLHDIPPAGSPSTSTIIATLAVTGATNFSFPIPTTGLPFSKQLGIVLSSTGPTYTASANLDLIGFATIGQP